MLDITPTPQQLLGKLPRRFQWALHNCVGHPMMEVCLQLGFSELANQFHDLTLPEEIPEDIEDLEEDTDREISDKEVPGLLAALENDDFDEYIDEVDDDYGAVGGVI